MSTQDSDIQREWAAFEQWAKQVIGKLEAHKFKYTQQMNLIPGSYRQSVSLLRTLIMEKQPRFEKYREDIRAKKLAVNEKEFEQLYGRFQNITQQFLSDYKEWRKDYDTKKEASGSGENPEVKDVLELEQFLEEEISAFHSAPNSQAPPDVEHGSLSSPTGNWYGPSPSMLQQPLPLAHLNYGPLAGWESHDGPSPRTPRLAPLDGPPPSYLMLSPRYTYQAVFPGAPQLSGFQQPPSENTGQMVAQMSAMALPGAPDLGVATLPAEITYLPLTRAPALTSPGVPGRSFQQLPTENPEQPVTDDEQPPPVPPGAPRLAFRELYKEE